MEQNLTQLNKRKNKARFSFLIVMREFFWMVSVVHKMCRAHILDVGGGVSVTGDDTLLLEATMA